jgi:putative ATPase
LNDLIFKEENWLNKQDHKKKFILQLEKLGWNIFFEEWTEFVYQKVDGIIIKRWLNQGSEYRETILKNCEEETLTRLQALFTRLDGRTIKQKLKHTQFFAKKNN